MFLNLIDIKFPWGQLGSIAPTTFWSLGAIAPHCPYGVGTYGLGNRKAVSPVIVSNLLLGVIVLSAFGVVNDDAVILYEYRKTSNRSPRLLLEHFTSGLYWRPGFY